MKGAIDYLRDLRAYAGPRLLQGFALIGIAALLEGVGILALIPLLSVVIGGDSSGAGAALLTALNSIGLTTPLTQTLAVAAAFLVVIALRGSVQWLRDRHMRKLSLGFVDAWRERTLRAITAAPWQRLSGQRRTNIEHAMMVDLNRLAFGTQQGLLGVVQLGIIVIQGVILAIISPAIFGLLLFLFAFALRFGSSFARRAQLLGGRDTLLGRQVHFELGNFLAGQRLARLHDTQDRFVEQILEVLQTSRRWQIDFVGSQAALRAVFQWLTALLGVATLLLGYFALGLDIAELIVVTILIVRIAAPALSLMQLAQSVANMLPAMEALKSLLEQLGEREDSALAAPQGHAPTPRHPDALLEAQDLWFGYGADRPVLQGASLSIGFREVVALDAPSGAGKTTFLDLITGLLPSTQGAVFRAGQPLLSAEDWRAWRSSIAYLPQDPFLFDMTIRENLTYFAPDASEADIERALALAGADPVIARAPQGLETSVQDRGEGLSGGERQRICLARALLSRPSLLILDEALNAIDEESAMAILGRVTGTDDHPAILLVTHQRPIRSFADRSVSLAEIQAGQG